MHWAILFLTCLTVAIAATHELTQEELDALATVPYGKLPRSLQLSINKQKRGGKGDVSHWCCANDFPVKIIQKTRLKVEYVRAHTKVKIGYTSCGFLGAGRCSLYDVRYKVEPRYFTEFYDAPDIQDCPDSQVKCCKGFVLVNNDSCLSIDEIKDHGDILLKLLQAGLLGEGK